MSDALCDLLCIDFEEAESLRATLPELSSSARTVDLLRALGDRTRLRLAHALELGSELCVCDLAWVIGASQGLVSHHLRQLKAAGLVESRRHGKLVMYQLTKVGRQLLSGISAVVTEDGLL